MWDNTEVLLKASLMDKEDKLLFAWIRGYMQSFSCYPRLHVVTGGSYVPKARALFSRVPNSTVRANNFTAAVEKTGTYHIIQWHCFWADNFTTADYVFFMDVDAIPVMPLRCHHFFDEHGRVIQHAWHGFTHWTRPCSNVFLDAQDRFGETFARPMTPATAALDFMTFWPIIAPRWAMPTMRRLVTRARNASYFDAAFIDFPVSHADLIGKTLVTVFPERTRLVMCPTVHNRTAHAVLAEVRAVEAGKQMPPARHSNASTRGAAHHHLLSAYGGLHSHPLPDFGCRDMVAKVEHVRHPLQGLHSPNAGVRFKNYHLSAEYAHELLNASRHLLHAPAGAGTIPPRLFHYAMQRNASFLGNLTAALVYTPPGEQLCGGTFL